MQAALQQPQKSPGVFWDPSQWDAALESCARATGLTLGVYDAEGQRVLGPYLHQPIAHMLMACGALAEGGRAQRFEQEVAARCLELGAPVSDLFENALVVCARPALSGDAQVGVFTYGWVYTRFPTPLAGERVARALGLPSNRFWLASREHLPVSSEKLQVYSQLLTTLTRSILEQLTFRRALIEADRMKDEFLSNLSHELRTPLTSVQLRVQTLGRSLPRDDPRIQHALEAIQNGIRSQARLINDLLDTSRILTGKMALELRPVNVAKVVRAAADTVAPMAQAKGVLFSVHAPDATRDLPADADRLQQLVWNLLVNGVKFTPAGGRVALELVETPAAFEISVRDTGIGIAAEFLPSVFDRFAQGQESFAGSQRGLGLGLALVRYIAELHGGTAIARSDGVGRGTVFRVRIPIP